jgi:D-3-phosphoglycerate dehydrogenase / 2-oxoglutarate reductase
MARKCLIVDDMHPSIFKLLEEIYWEYDYRPSITRDEIKKILAGFQGLIIRSKTKVDADLLASGNQLQFIGRAGAGLDNVDVDYINQLGVKLIHGAEGNRDAVGEFALGGLLSLMRNIPRADKEVRQGTWEREGNRGEELMNKTVALIGYGNMGQAFAKRLSGFSCKILAFDKYKRQFSDGLCAEASMEQIYAEADILSLHIPLTMETRFMVDEAYFNRFKKNIIFLNTARGEIVAFQAILNALESGKVRGAILDVLENEKINNLTSAQQQSFKKLVTRDNVILTPHIAGWTFESHEKINVALVTKMKMLGL